MCDAKNTAPKSQVLSDMPKSVSRVSNDIENYIIHKTDLCGELVKLYCSLNIYWIAFLNGIEDAELTPQETKLLELRFLSGAKWKVCAALMPLYFPNERWNINKVFKTYRDILHKIKENNCAVC